MENSTQIVDARTEIAGSFSNLSDYRFAKAQGFTRVEKTNDSLELSSCVIAKKPYTGSLHGDVSSSSINNSQNSQGNIKALPAILFYDGACPLCSREINGLKRKIDPAKIVFKDIHNLSDDAIRKLFAERACNGVYNQATVPSRATLLKQLHLLSNGSVRTGFDANLALWETTAYARYFHWLRFKPIFLSATFFYEIWARLRYRKLYCNDQSACGDE